MPEQNHAYWIKQYEKAKAQNLSLHEVLIKLIQTCSSAGTSETFNLLELIQETKINEDHIGVKTALINFAKENGYFENYPALGIFLRLLADTLDYIDRQEHESIVNNFFKKEWSGSHLDSIQAKLKEYDKLLDDRHRDDPEWREKVYQMFSHCGHFK